MTNEGLTVKLSLPVYTYPLKNHNFKETLIPTKLSLTSLQGSFSICQLDPSSEIPEWALKGAFFSITRTSAELSIICEDIYIPDNINCEMNWRALMIEGPFNFGEIGILNSITTPLARAQISLLAISTFDTDYILIQDSHFLKAINIFKSVGHQVR